MARFTLGLGIFLILAGITVATYVGVKGPKDMATQAQTAIAAVLICGPGVLLALIGAIWLGRMRK